MSKSTKIILDSHESKSFVKTIIPKKDIKSSKNKDTSTSESAKGTSPPGGVKDISPSEGAKGSSKKDTSPPEGAKGTPPVFNNLSEVSSFGLPEYEDLVTSTVTVMIYTNLSFNFKEIFNGIQTTDVDIPLTKKQKNVDKKKIKAPYGTIIGVRHGTKIKGVHISKKKKHWCTICQPKKIEGEKETKIKTVNEIIVDDKELECKRIMYNCSKCNKTYNPETIKKINHFLNQVTFLISIGKSPILNVMMFKDSLKIVGCKDVEDASEAMLILWQDFISKIPNSWSSTNNKRAYFLFDIVMKNVDFKLGFKINRSKLNTLMNEKVYSNVIFMSQYVSTGNTNVNIKAYLEKPKNYKYDVLVIPLDSKYKPYYTTFDKNIYKKKKKKKTVTFIVFASSEVILSGRYDSVMKDRYKFFVNAVFNNRKYIEETIRRPNKSEIDNIIRGNL